MSRSELRDRVFARQAKDGLCLPVSDIDAMLRNIIEQITKALVAGQRVEIRGFGSFSMRHRKARLGRNPQNGEPIGFAERYVPHFKPGDALRTRVDEAMHAGS